MNGKNTDKVSDKRPTTARQALKGHDAGHNAVQFIRNQMSGRKILGILILAAISIVFVFFGYSGKMNRLGVGNAATVNDTIISVGELQQEEQRIMRMYESLTGGKMDMSLQRNLIQQEAIRSLIQSELVAQNAKKSGLMAPDDEVRDFIIKKIPFLQKDGRFQREMYFNYLEATHATPAMFENMIRKMVLQQKISHLFEVAGRPSTLDLSVHKDLNEIKVNVSFLKVDPSEILKAGGETASATLKELDAAVSAKDEAKVNALAKSLKLEWTETGFAELSSAMLPKLQSPQVMAAIGETSAEAPLLGRYVYEQNVKYVIKVKEVKRVPEKDQGEKLAQRSSSFGLYQNWLTDFRKGANVVVNQDLLRGSQSE